ncbi:SLATT domain-containing protein [Intestinibacter bartlettii]|uniref:SLATT domain-containing protein n=2 Tax=Intestinibacter bartlettii TaxID=261299 RepID=UPI001105B5D6|nr:SLATT domain-containing protein [Intestinibacter bartlettii]
MMGVIYIKNLEIIESQIRQMLASIVWTHKIQEKQSDIYKWWYNFWETIRIVAGAVTTSGIIAILFLDEYWIKVITAGISIITLFIDSYLKVYDLKVLSNTHKSSALDLLKLREETISVLCDIKLNKYTEETLIEKRDYISQRQMEIYINMLDCSDKAVEKASESLKEKGDSTYSEEEIDSFLPILARKNK